MSGGRRCFRNNESGQWMIVNRQRRLQTKFFRYHQDAHVLAVMLYTTKLICVKSELPSRYRHLSLLRFGLLFDVLLGRSAEPQSCRNRNERSVAGQHDHSTAKALLPLELLITS